jgi:hypothetical protein
LSLVRGQAELVGVEAESDGDPQETADLEVLAALDSVDGGRGDTNLPGEFGLARGAAELADVLADLVQVKIDVSFLDYLHHRIPFVLTRCFKKAMGRLTGSKSISYKTYYLAYIIKNDE